MEKDEKMWGMLCHLSTFAAFIGVPFGNIIAPLIIWLIKKEESPFVDHHGKEALNFQISMTIYSIVAALLCFVFVGFILLPVVIIADIVLTIIASVRANAGEMYVYPYTIRFIS